MNLFENIYDGYAYSYPHKHSYRHMEPRPLRDLWHDEKRDALFLYVHLPFCEMRCGFCNLFTIAHPQANMVDDYLAALTREAHTVKTLIDPERFAQMAIGGGTPTFLSVGQLSTLFDIIRSLGCDPTEIPAAIEMSPATVTKEKLDFLKTQGISRASIGIQSFTEAEVKSMGRPQKNKEVYAALDLMKQAGFPTVNLDLIYGVQTQTLTSWLFSVQEAIRYEVEEIFLYPLYIRPLTGINRIPQDAHQDSRFSFYKEAKKLLLSSGYTQVSMRLFRRTTAHKTAVTYSCQEDGMIGIGAGARSYTRTTHYSSEYAVARQNIRSIIENYIAKEDYSHIDYGIELDKEEQQRRFVIKSILHGTGLDLRRYQTLFDNDARENYPLLDQLVDNKLAHEENGLLQLTPAGLDYSDAIGPRLYSSPIQKLINEFELT